MLGGGKVRHGMNNTQPTLPFIKMKKKNTFVINNFGRVRTFCYVAP